MVKERNGVCAKLPRNGNSGDALRAKGGFGCSCTDPETRYALMHEAEDLLMSTGCIVPLYYYTDIYMLDSNIHGFFSNPLGYKYFMYCTIG